MPELPRFAVELDRRFGEIGDMLDGHPSARAPAIDHFRCRLVGYSRLREGADGSRRRMR
jgi:hypothetical protein